LFRVDGGTLRVRATRTAITRVREQRGTTLLWCELRIFPLDGAGAGIHNFRQQPLLSPHDKLRLLYTKMIGNTEYLGGAELGGTVIPRTDCKADHAQDYLLQKSRLAEVASRMHKYFVPWSVSSLETLRGARHLILLLSEFAAQHFVPFMLAVYCLHQITLQCICLLLCQRRAVKGAVCVCARHSYILGPNFRIWASCLEARCPAPDGRHTATR